MSIAYSICLSLLMFALGAASALLLMHMKRKRKIHIIKRLFPNLPIARDVYNKVSAHLDKEQANFQLVSLEVKRDKKMEAYAVICKYKSLGNEIFTF